jgi:hypothetical protein
LDEARKWSGWHGFGSAQFRRTSLLSKLGMFTRCISMAMLQDVAATSNDDSNTPCHSLTKHRTSKHSPSHMSPRFHPLFAIPAKIPIDKTTVQSRCAACLAWSQALVRHMQVVHFGIANMRLCPGTRSSATCNSATRACDSAGRCDGGYADRAVVRRMGDRAGIGMSS